MATIIANQFKTSAKVRPRFLELSFEGDEPLAITKSDITAAEKNKMPLAPNPTVEMSSLFMFSWISVFQGL